MNDTFQFVLKALSLLIPNLIPTHSFSNIFPWQRHDDIAKHNNNMQNSLTLPIMQTFSTSKTYSIFFYITENQPLQGCLQLLFISTRKICNSKDLNERIVTKIKKFLFMSIRIVAKSNMIDLYCSRLFINFIFRFLSIQSLLKQ